MAIDWSVYPSLPEPPKLPEWRDTPEREACYRDCLNAEDITFTKAGGGLFVLLVILEILVLGWRMALMGFLCLLGFIPVLLVHFICTRIWLLIQEFRIARKHGFSHPIKPKRRNIDPEIAAVLAERPAFDAAAFRACWPTSEHADMAEWVLKVGEWRFHGKMLYPNDPLHLFFSERCFMSGKMRSVPSSDDFFSDLGMDPEGVLTWDSSLAELVEFCMKVHWENNEAQKSGAGR